MTHSDHPPYRPDIDGLRAVAVLAVVGFHAFPELFPGGFAGVDIFFVISGFLITNIILRGLAQGTFSFSDFYSRRIRRIFPALLMMLGSCLVAGYFLFFADEYKRLGYHAVSGVFFFANFALWKEVGYFDTAADFKPLLHLWSLGIEEQFYLLWPLLLWWAFQREVRIPRLVSGLLVLSLGLNLWAIKDDAAATFFLPHTRFWELLAGAALAAKHVPLPSGSSRIRNIASLLGGGLVLGAVFGLDRNVLYPGAWALLPVLGAALLIWAGGQAWFNREVLAGPAMVFVGLISYPLYLWHWPLLSFPRVIEAGEIPTLMRGAAVLLAFLLAWLTYRYLERFVRFRATVLVPGALIVSGLVVAFIGHYVRNQDGMDARFTFVKEAAALFHEGTVREINGCMKQLALQLKSDDRYCIVSSPDMAKAGKSLLMLGDSHGRVLGRGLLALPLQRRYGYEVVSVGWSGCPPFVGVERHERGKRRGCDDFGKHLLPLVGSFPSIDTVVIVARYSMYFSGRGFGDRQYVMLRSANGLRDGESAGNEEIAARGLEETLSLLSKTGKRIVLVHQVPELDFSPRRCVDRPLAASRTLEQCAVSRTIVEQRQASYRAGIAKVLQRYPQVIEFDPMEHLCSDTSCETIGGGRHLYYDNNHLSVSGAAGLGAALMDELASRKDQRGRRRP